MLSLYRTLSSRYLSRFWFRSLLIVASISLGVATLVATQSLSRTMDNAGVKATNPLAGLADLLVGNGESFVDLELVKDLRELKGKGIKSIQPRIFGKVTLPGFDNLSALLIGVDASMDTDSGNGKAPVTVEFDKEVFGIDAFLGSSNNLFGPAAFKGGSGAFVGKNLAETITPEQPLFRVVAQPTRNEKERDGYSFTRVGIIDAKGPAAALAGNTIVAELAPVGHILGLPKGKAHRIDIVLEPDADRNELQKKITELVKGRAEVTTPEESNQMVQNVFSGIRTGFSMCGIAALVIGLFLVYNALAVSVTERRHEIGILLSVGATKRQVQLLFAGEAALMGLGGAVLGVPLGLGLAYMGLQPVQEAMSKIFMDLDAKQVEFSTSLIILAGVTGITTAVLAALIPAMQAANENPAEAVRRIPPKPTLSYRLIQLSSAGLCMVLGTILILLRSYLPSRFGTFGGLVLVLLGTLIATPQLAAFISRLLQPLVRAIMGIEGRLAADNVVRSPARTGLVIAALAAGVALVMQTAGIIKSNRQALRDWVRETIGADIFVSSGSAVSAAAGEPMAEDLAGVLEKLDPVNKALAVRHRKMPFNKKQIYMIALEAGETYRLDQKRKKANPLYKQIAEQKNSIIVSENFIAMHRVKTGETITLTSPGGPIKLKIIGKMPDYTWNHGSVFIDRKEFLRHWNDPKVDIFDVYLQGDPTPKERKEISRTINRTLGAEFGIKSHTRKELVEEIDSTIEGLYGIAYGQQIVVMIVAALGVVTALMISVLQRRREMGLLRAIGASQVQVVRSVLAEAALMGVIGTIIGLVIGIPIEWYGLQIVMLEECGYLFPVYIPWTESLIIAAFALLLATLAGLGPALYAVRQRIPEAISYE